MLILLGLLMPLSDARMSGDASDEPARPVYLCDRTSSALRIDGRLDEPDWIAAPWSDPFVDIRGTAGPIPPLRTRMKMLWDDQALYVAAELQEPQLWATLTERDAVIYQENDFELFLDPDGDTHRYAELEINALGTVWDLLLERPYRDGGPALSGWDIAGLCAAVHLDGTLNDPSDTDRGWQVEIALPWSALEGIAPGGGPPREGAVWRANFSRVAWRREVVGGTYVKAIDPATGRTFPEDNWVWSPQRAVNMHEPEYWGRVLFRGVAAGSPPLVPALDPEGPSRWLLRRVYYAQREHQRREGRYTDDPARLGLTAGETERLTLVVVGATWTASVPAATGGGTWYIREDGRIWRP